MYVFIYWTGERFKEEMSILSSNWWGYREGVADLPHALMDIAAYRAELYVLTSLFFFCSIFVVVDERRIVTSPAFLDSASLRHASSSEIYIHVCVSFSIPSLS